MVGFMKRRCRRLYPHYIPVLLIFLLINYPNVSFTEWLRNIFGNITGFSFWTMTGNQFNWYILAIIMFYILTPLFFETINKYDNRGLLVLLFISSVLVFCCVPAEPLVKAVSRFSIYILGVAAGVKLSAGKEIEDSCTTKVLIIVGGIIGFIMLHSIEWNNRKAIMTVGIGDKAARGCGYGSEAIEMILRFAFMELNLNRVGLDVISDNTPAIECYQKAGFTVEGRARESVIRFGEKLDLIYMGILYDDWVKRQ